MARSMGILKFGILLKDSQHEIYMNLTCRFGSQMVVLPMIE